ncbi:metal-dependent hydrolase [Sporomusa ovata DSM 2662]|uniref:Outer membrane protein romA n=1 Tax=Sporomusa ovata TaxID=2378 RepID=A0A0U1KXP0_9FIRM|nr:MBL fold metallo-hydrolase [Sporomusa ovata]EQB28687.1 outer membrane protein RomA [Sporomusa ovata DSM 2662]CQR72197.1 Outer membrane protein romA [Sporomusa ovata]
MKYARTIKILLNRIKMNFKKFPNRRPPRPIPVVKPELDRFLRCDQSQAMWFGHSTVLIQIEGKTILCDPVLTELFFLFTIFTGKKFTAELPLTIEEVPSIDILLLSHNHYDHMDRRTIMALKNKVKHYCVPQGVGACLEKWGIRKADITELSYGQTLYTSDLILTCTPSSHFSGRALNDRNKTLWCSWVIAGKETNIFFSGDGGYGPHLKEIGDKHGPFDITFMECGQANTFFGQIHMIPEKAIQAQLDLKGKLMVPIHWGMFSQSNTDWTAQVERLLSEAQQKGVQVATPMIGEVITIGADKYPNLSWWRNYR